MKNQQKLPQFKISQFDFIITPKQIQFSANLRGVYLLQFNKGAQVLHKFEEEIKMGDKQAKLKFRGGQRCNFKLINEKNSACEWAIYQQQQQIRSEFIDSIPVNIFQHYSKYIQNLKDNALDYARLLNSKNQSNSISISRQWRKLKQKLNSIQKSGCASNKDSSVQIRFQLEIKCEIDYLVETEDNNTTKIMRKVDSLEDIFQKRNEKSQLPQMSKLQDSQNHEQYNRVEYFDEEHKITVNTPVNAPLIESGNYLQKKSTLLSDIIEASNQTSTNKNYGDKKIQLKQISGIPEQLDELNSPYVPISSTKTHNFDTADNNEVCTFKKRSNTLESSHSQPGDYSNNSSIMQLRKVNDLSNVSQDQLLEQQQLKENLRLTNINSTIKEDKQFYEKGEKPQQTKKLNDKSSQKKGSRKYVIILVFFLSALAIFALLSNNKSFQVNKQQRVKSIKIKSQKQKSPKQKSEIKQQKRK